MWLIPPPDRLLIYQIQILQNCRLSNIAQDIKVISASGRLCSYYVTQCMEFSCQVSKTFGQQLPKASPLSASCKIQHAGVATTQSHLFLTFGVLADFCSFVPRRLSGSTVKDQIRVPNYAETKLKPDLISKTAP